MLGGGVLLAVAAALWLVYLVPNWLRRGEYLSTERNAVRLQQTLRTLAETAETPEAVRVKDAAGARALARELAERPVAVGDVARSPLPARLDPRVIARRRLRRTRLIVLAVVAAGLAAAVVQGVVGVMGGLAAVSLPAVAITATVVVAGIALLTRLAKVSYGRANPTTDVADRRPRRSTVVSDIAVEVAAPRVSREWTPVPVPRPSYLRSRDTVTPVSPAEVARAAARAEADLSEAADVAARALRAAQDRVPVATPAVASTESAGSSEAATERSASRYAQMGVVDTKAVPAMPDIAQALRRRRAG